MSSPPAAIQDTSFGFEAPSPVSFLVCLPDGRQETKVLHVRTEMLAAPPQRRYVLELTDAADLRFLYFLHLTEGDYMRLKGEKGLDVDFPSFPRELEHFLALCADGSGAFVAKLVLTEPLAHGAAELNIMRRETLGLVPYLQLRLVRASDNDVIGHLVRRLAAALHDASGLRAAVQALEDRSRQAELELRDAKAILPQTQLQHQSALSTARDEATAALTELTARHAAQVDKLHEEVKALNAANTSLTASNGHLETSLADTQARLEVALRRAKDGEAAAAGYKATNFDLQGTNEELTAAVRQRDIQLAGLQQRVDDLERELPVHRQLVATTQSEKASLEEAVADLRSRVGDLSRTATTQKAALGKRVARVAALESKIKMKNTVAKEQELEIRRLERDNGDVRLERDRLAAELESARNKLSAKQREVDDLRPELKKKNDMLNHMTGDMLRLQAQNMGGSPGVTAAHGRHVAAAPSSTTSFGRTPAPPATARPTLPRSVLQAPSPFSFGPPAPVPGAPGSSTTPATGLRPFDTALRASMFDSSSGGTGDPGATAPTTGSSFASRVASPAVIRMTAPATS